MGWKENNRRILPFQEPANSPQTSEVGCRLFCPKACRIRKLGSLFGQFELTLGPVRFKITPTHCSMRWHLPSCPVVLSPLRIRNRTEEALYVHAAMVASYFAVVRCIAPSASTCRNETPA